MDSIVVLAVVAALMCASPCRGYVFYVGGRDGWVEQPRESYGSWSGRNRFQVNDTLGNQSLGGQFDRSIDRSVGRSLVAACVDFGVSLYV